MPLVHVEPDQLYLASRSLWQANYQAIEVLFRLRVTLLRLESTWQGGRAEEYIAESRDLLQLLNARMEELITMSLILSRQADQWDESDQRWSGVYGRFFSSPGE